MEGIQNQERTEIKVKKPVNSLSLLLYLSVNRIQDFLISNPVLNFHHAGIFAIFAPVALCFRYDILPHVRRQREL